MTAAIVVLSFLAGVAVLSLPGWLLWAVGRHGGYRLVAALLGDVGQNRGTELLAGAMVTALVAVVLGIVFLTYLLGSALVTAMAS